MLPAGPLMIEHRLIERMIAVIGKETARIKEGGSPDPNFILTAVDFIRTYADKLHHGKEEDILFRDLEKKPLTDQHRRTMDELVEEHKQGRLYTGRLVEARIAYLAGNRNAVREIVETMSFLAGFYPKHIEKEDKHFFLPVMDYFGPVEKEEMLREFYDFDRRFVHLKYSEIVSGLDGIEKEVRI